MDSIDRLHADEAAFQRGRPRPNGEDDQATPEPDVPRDEEPNSLRPLRVDELLQRPAPRWLVRDLLPERSLAVMFGASGSGKTFAALDLACSIARGEHWFGRRVRPGNVIYVAGEGHLKVRLQAYLQNHALEAGALSRLRIIPSRLNLLLDASGDLLALERALKVTACEVGGIVLVVLDTLNAMMPGGNENASEDMGQMIVCARWITEQLNCAVLYIHHSGKDESKGSRGHSSLKAAVDAEIQVTGDNDRTIEAVKVRDGEAGQRFGFRLHPIDLGPDPDPEADQDERISSCVVTVDALDRRPVKAQRRDVALDALREAIFEFGDRLPGTSTIPPGVKGATLDQWKARWILRTGYDSGRTADANFCHDKAELLKRNVVGISKPHVWIN